MFICLLIVLINKRDYGTHFLSIIFIYILQIKSKILKLFIFLKGSGGLVSKIRNITLE